MKTSLFSFPKILLLAGLATLFNASLHAETEVYEIDTVHSGVTFKVRYLLSQVPGRFENFSGTMHLDRENMTKSKIVAEIKVDSVNTNNTKRDAHLKNEDFFNEPKNPLMKFESTEWKKVSDTQFHITGDLTMNGVTKPVTLDAKLDGFTVHPGNKSNVTGWTATATIDRNDWNISYGSGVVGSEVEIQLDILAILQTGK